MKANQLKRMVATGAVGVALFVGATAAWAQHEFPGKFDTTKPVQISGIVTLLDWRNPRAHIFVNVTNRVNGRATVLNYAVEIESPIILEQNGWNRTSLRPGDAITVKGNPARDGSRQVWGSDVRFTATGVQVFQEKPKMSTTGPLSRPTPRWPDGHPALGSLPGQPEGYWGNPSKTALVEDGVEVKMDEYGILANIADAPKVAPMTPWALGVYQHRQSRQLRDDPMFINCKPPGGTRMYQSPLGVQLIEDRQRKRVFVLMGSGNHNYHIIYLDGRKQVGLVGGDDDNPLYFGRSVGQWEGDTLVVDTKGYNEDFWFTNGGLPHTSDLHLVERYTRLNMDTLRYEVKVEDPSAYTRTWSASWTLQWNGGATLPSHFCQNNRQ